MSLNDLINEQMYIKMLMNTYYGMDNIPYINHNEFLYDKYLNIKKRIHYKCYREI